MDIELFKFIRTSRGLTQTEFARKIGVSRSLIAQIEVGYKTITPVTIRKLKQAFNLTGDDLEAYREFLNSVN